MTGVGLAQPGASLAAVLDSFAALGFPVACIAEPAAEPPETDAEPEQRARPNAADVLRARVERDDPLCEFVAYARGLAALTPFAMARAAHDARATLSAALLADTDRRFSPRIAAIACDTQDKPLAPAGLPAAGFRTCLVLPDADTPVSSEIWDNGTLRVFGGAVLPVEAAMQALGQPRRDQFADFIYLSLADFAAGTPDEAAERATGYARIALDRERDGEISNLLLSDWILRDDFGFGRDIALHLFQPAPDADTAGYERLKTEITKLGFTFSESGDTPPDAVRKGQYLWIPEAAAPDNTPVRLDSVRSDCTGWADGVVLENGAQAPEGQGVQIENEVWTVPGVDDCGCLHLVAVSVEDVLNGESRARRDLGSSNDVVLTVAPETAATTPGRSEVLKLLRKLDEDGVTRFIGVDGFARSRYPRSNLITRFQRVQAARTGQRRPKRISAWDRKRAAYVEDARHAWSYIDSYSNTLTGLCPSVVETGPGGGGDRLETVTMWDVASLLNALASAHDLGFIDQGTFEARMMRIMPNLKGRETDGRRLPQEWIKTDRIKWGNRNFDACDTGRLLAALANLTRGSGPDFGIPDLVASWDLDKVIIDGNIHSVLDGKLVSVTRSHCADYAARAFRHWGLDAVSPYEVFAGRSAVDGRMQLLNTANDIGIMGAEPLLLNANDFGATAESDYLADVLFAAQVRWFAETGQLVCVSETPLNREPWFAYEGLAFDKLSNEWRVEPASDKDKFQTAAFQRDTLSLSCKAAFLWAAHRPHDYADRLVAHIREHGKTKIGFVSGIYVETGEPMRGYADLNTNGIILQAIGKILARDTAP